MKPDRGEKGGPAEGVAMERGGWFHTQVTLRIMEIRVLGWKRSREQERGSRRGSEVQDGVGGAAVCARNSDL